MGPAAYRRHSTTAAEAGGTLNVATRTDGLPQTRKQQQRTKKHRYKGQTTERRNKRGAGLSRDRNRSVIGAPALHPEEERVSRIASGVGHQSHSPGLTWTTRRRRKTFQSNPDLDWPAAPIVFSRFFAVSLFRLVVGGYASPRSVPYRLWYFFFHLRASRALASFHTAAAAAAVSHS